MEKRQIFIYSGIALLGLGAMVGTVLFLRYRSAPEQVIETVAKPPARAAVSQVRGTAAGIASTTTGKVRPYTKIEDVPYERPWQQGDPSPPKLDQYVGDDINQQIYLQQP